MAAMRVVPSESPHRAAASLGSNRLVVVSRSDPPNSKAGLAVLIITPSRFRCGQRRLTGCLGWPGSGLALLLTGARPFLSRRSRDAPRQFEDRADNRKHHWSAARSGM